MRVDAPDETEHENAEEQERIHRRYKEAREYEFTKAQSRRFSESDADIGVLRKLKAQGCPPNLAYRILRPLAIRPKGV